MRIINKYIFSYYYFDLGAGPGAETTLTETTAPAIREALVLAHKPAVVVTQASPLEPMALRLASPTLHLPNRIFSCNNNNNNK